MALLLTAAAIVFFWLGWRWGGHSQPVVEKSAAPAAEAPAASTAAEAATDKESPASPASPQPGADATRLQAQLEEAEHHRRNLEKELIRVHEELKSARHDAAQHKQDAQAAKDEAARLSTEAAGLRREIARLEKELASKPEPAGEPAAPAKTPRPRKSPASAKTKTAAVATLDAATAQQRIATGLQAKRQLLSVLEQERDDWQRRVATLRESGKDPAGLNLARKSLERVEQQVADARRSEQHLQHQERALKRSLETAATLSHEDDLTRIKGIKSILRDQLHALGVKTFQQIASWSEEDTQAFSELLGFKDRAKRDAWVRQASELGGKQDA